MWIYKHLSFNNNETKHNNPWTPNILEATPKSISSTALQDYSGTSPANRITLYVILQNKKKKQEPKTNALFIRFTKTLPLSLSQQQTRRDYFYAHLYLLKAYVE